MDLSSIDVGRFEVGNFGDLRLEKRGLGVIRFWRLHRDRAFWLWQVASGAARSGSGGFCVTPQ